MTPELITTSSQMDDLVSQLAKVNLIAVDTEFFRETSYYPELALVQIATDSIVACIDPLAFDAKPGLQKILLDNRITKVFHSCSQDMEVLYYFLGDTPSPVYDTQLANALLTVQHQLGYAALVENELGVQLDKSQTRTNWLQRPLTKKQIQYAGDDVFYLYQLHHKLDQQLLLKGRKTWFEEDSLNLLSDASSFQVDTSKLWKRVKGSSRLNRSQLAIVQSVAQWREGIAQQLNKTRRKVLADDSIIQLALNPPGSISSLQQHINRKHLLNKDQLASLFDVLQIARQQPESQWPDNRFSMLDGEQKQLLKTLQQLVNEKADQLGISNAILYSRKDLENLILAHDNEQQLDSLALNSSQNWRYQVVGQHLIDTVKNTK